MNSKHTELSRTWRPLRRLPGPLLAALAVAGLGMSGPGSPEKAAEPFRIGPEDVVRVQMPDHPELDTTAPVRPDGRLALPLLGDVEAAGRSPEELAAFLMDAYRRFVTEPNVAVVVTEIHSRKVYVLGEVSTPGEYPLGARMRVLQAVAVAGGFTPFARRERVVLLRETEEGQVRLELNLKRAYADGDAEQNPVLAPGDTVVVP